MLRSILLLAWVPLALACSQTVTTSPPHDTGSAVPDASTPPDAGIRPDASAPDTGLECPDGTELDEGQCVDINECLTNNGGCGDPESWHCENREASPPRCTFDCRADYRSLMEGVTQFRMGDRVWPSALITHGPTACPLIRNPQGKIVVASARLGQGRILQVGHQHPMNRDLNLDGHHGEQLMRNAVAWMGGDGDAPRIGRHPQQFNAPVNRLREDGFSVSGLRPSVEGLSEIDVYFVNSRNDYSDEEIQALNDYVRGGGGLISSGFAWAWGQGDREAAVTGFPGNKNLMGSGLTITKANQGAGPMVVTTDPLPATHHALYALFAVARHLSGSRLLDEEDKQAAVQTISFAIEHLPLSLESYYLPARELLRDLPPVVPTRDSPVTPASEPLRLLVLRLVDKLASGLPADQIQAHPAAADFPGAVSSDGARTPIEIRVNASYVGRSRQYNYSGAAQPRRVSTGAYAIAGEVLRITIPARAVSQGLEVQIGTHSDRLWNKDSIQRFPQLVRRDPLTQETTASASAFGGPVYLLVPPGTEVGPIDLRLEGVVRAPYYRHGITDLEDWRQQLLDSPAPWAEIEGDRVIFSVHTEEARSLQDPVELMNFWDAVLDAMADLEGSPHERLRKERFTLDRQISAGALHSGYPIMGHLNHHGGLLNLEQIRSQGSWGPFHELGHNHQWNDWFLPGTTEATCNLWSVYIHEMILSLPTRQEGRLGPAERLQRRQNYLNGGADFQEDWNVWVALDTYLQLQEGFGWELFSTVFADYRRESDAAEGSAQDRIDEWVRRTSLHTQRNLGPFYQAWGFPVSDDVIAEIGRLPDWLDDPMN